MTLSELKEYQTLQSNLIFYEVEIKRLTKLKNEKVSYYASPALSGTPGGGKISMPTEEIAILQLSYSAEIDKQIKQNELKLIECREKLKAIEDFIDNVSDSEIQSLLNRHIKQNVSFRQLAREKFVSRNYVSKKIRSVCENNANSDNMPLYK